MKERFTEKVFREKTLAIIECANRIIEEYQADGLTLTLRQLYYQFVAKDLLANTERNYKRLGNIISDGREAGLIDWDAIEDRTRNLAHNQHFNSPAHILSVAARSYQIDKWADQDFRVEVWIEKEALAGVLAQVCPALDVPYFACKGYVSASEQYNAAKRFQKYIDDGQRPVVIHLGDHDPSGIDMTRDNHERLSMYTWDNIHVIRLALNMDQVEEYNPPPNPAKMTDSRFSDYGDKYGDESWELDALDPSVLRDLIQNKVNDYMDFDKMAEARSREEEHRQALMDYADEWDADHTE